MSMKVRLKGIAKVGAGLLVYLTPAVIGTLGVIKLTQGLIEIYNVGEEYNQSDERKEDILDTNQKIFEFKQMKEQNLISQNEYQEYLDYYNSGEYYSLQLRESSFGGKLDDAYDTFIGSFYYILPAMTLVMPQTCILCAKSHRVRGGRSYYGGRGHKDIEFSAFDNEMMDYIIDGTYEVIMGKPHHEEKSKEKDSEKQQENQRIF